MTDSTTSATPHAGSTEPEPAARPTAQPTEADLRKAAAEAWAASGPHPHGCVGSVVLVRLDTHSWRPMLVTSAVDDGAATRVSGHLFCEQDDYLSDAARRRPGSFISMIGGTHLLMLGLTLDYGTAIGQYQFTAGGMAGLLQDL